MEEVTVEVGKGEAGRQSKNGEVEGRQEPAMMRPCANLWRGFGSEGRQKTDSTEKPKARDRGGNTGRITCRGGGAGKIERLTVRRSRRQEIEEVTVENEGRSAEKACRIVSQCGSECRIVGIMFCLAL